MSELLFRSVIGELMKRFQMVLSVCCVALLCFTPELQAQGETENIMTIWVGGNRKNINIVGPRSSNDFNTLKEARSSHFTLHHVGTDGMLNQDYPQLKAFPDLKDVHPAGGFEFEAFRKRGTTTSYVTPGKDANAIPATNYELLVYYSATGLKDESVLEIKWGTYELWLSGHKVFFNGYPNTSGYLHQNRQVAANQSVKGAHLRLQVVGTKGRFKFWFGNKAEPNGWSAEFKLIEKQIGFPKIRVVAKSINGNQPSVRLGHIRFTRLKKQDNAKIQFARLQKLLSKRKISILYHNSGESETANARKYWYRRLVKATRKAAKDAGRVVGSIFKDNGSGKPNLNLGVQGFRYRVAKKANGNLEIFFEQNSKVRHHTNPGFAPFGIVNATPKVSIIVKKGQWLEGLVNGRWSLLVEADNR